VKVNRYLYNGKEIQNDHNLGLYDYGARFYDPVIGRWSVMDPLSDSYTSYSPYNYTLNNPIKFFDPNGMWVDIPRGYSTTDPREISDFINRQKVRNPDRKKFTRGRL